MAMRKVDIIYFKKKRQKKSSNMLKYCVDQSIIQILNCQKIPDDKFKFTSCKLVDIPVSTLNSYHHNFKPENF